VNVSLAVDNAVWRRMFTGTGYEFNLLELFILLWSVEH